MFDAAVEALQALADPTRLAWLSLGVLVGVFVGLVPGIGGVTGMVVLLPLVYGMDPYTGIAMLVAMMATTTTSDTFTSVLFGIPGGAASQATILDGYPMARRGEAQRALTAAFGSALFGGLFGAVVLLAVIPVAKPLVLALKSPDLFMLVVLGLCLVATVSSGSLFKGLLAGFLGMLLSTVGMTTGTAELRYVFGVEFLVNGISLIVVATALFAIPEVIGLVVENKSVSRSATVQKGGRVKGFRDVLANKRLVLLSSGLGTVLGAIPGVGGSIIDWITYGTAKNMVRRDNTFGSGDVRGVIAPEAATSAKEGGSLVPTLLFGVPGGALTAVLLGGLTMLGIQPGPAMVNDANLPLFLTIVWTLALATTIGLALCLILSGPISRITRIPARRFAPFLVVFVVIGTYQASRSWGDLMMMIGLGLVAYLMKLADWPRPPLLIGFVLGVSAERYLTVSVSLEGWGWINSPTVLVLMFVCALAVTFGVLGSRRDRAQQAVLDDLDATGPSDLDETSPQEQR